MLKQTKIVATIGPASDNIEVLRDLMLNGLNVVRINFSHAQYDESIARIKMVNELNEELNTHVGWLCDTKGPEIRTNLFKDGKVFYDKDQVIKVFMNEVEGNEEGFSITYPNLYDCVKVGGQILVDDGLIALDILSVNPEYIECRVCNEGFISNRKGINVPNAILKMDYLSPKDIADIEFGCDNGASYIAASFVRRKDDVLAVRAICDRKGREDMQIISKIENQEGVTNIKEILQATDGIMVARGDLGTEIPMEEVPLVQKYLCEACNRLGKPVIIATQMLDSMERNPRPTRAEVGDVSRAVSDGADAVMLSGESANGKYPVEAVDAMARIASRSETRIKHAEIIKSFINDMETNPYDGIGLSAVELARNIRAKAIFCFTESGATPRLISKYRPTCPIFALSEYEATLQSLSLNWGVFGRIKKGYTKISNKYAIVNDEAKALGFVKGDFVIITGGHPDGSKLTNFLKILEVE